MNKIRQIIMSTFLFSMSIMTASQLTACQSEVKNNVIEKHTEQSQTTEQETVEKSEHTQMDSKAINANNITTLVGTYASEGYDKKEAGYDWIVVKVTAGSEANTLAIDISARDDIKKPTCGLATTANAVANGQYLAKDDGTAILFAFDNDTLSVSAGEGSDAHDLMYYCSGGGSISGTYLKLAN